MAKTNHSYNSSYKSSASHPLPYQGFDDTRCEEVFDNEKMFTKLIQDFESLSPMFSGMDLQSIFIAPMVGIIDSICDILDRTDGNLVTISTTHSRKLSLR